MESLTNLVLGEALESSRTRHLLIWTWLFKKIYIFRVKGEGSLRSFFWGGGLLIPLPNREVGHRCPGPEPRAVTIRPIDTLQVKPRALHISAAAA